MSNHATATDPTSAIDAYADPGEMTARESHIWEAKYALAFKSPVMWDPDDPGPWRDRADVAVNEANAAVNSLRLVTK